MIVTNAVFKKMDHADPRYPERDLAGMFRSMAAALDRMADKEAA